MLFYGNASSDKREHLLIGTKVMLPDCPVYQVCTVPSILVQRRIRTRSFEVFMKNIDLISQEHILQRHYIDDVIQGCQRQMALGPEHFLKG